MALLKITGGLIHDPLNGIDGVVKDIWIRDGVIIAEPAHESPDWVIDAAGLVVMPGGVDMHAHIAGPKVNFARKMRPEDRRRQPAMPRTRLQRSGTLGSTPSTFATGYLYAGLGYTTVFDAAIPPLGARHTHEEFHDTPIIDKGFFVLLGNNLYALEQLANGETDRLRDYIAWILNATRGYAIKAVNPGGVENWKRGGEHNTGIDDPVADFNLTPRQIISGLAKEIDALGLPHSLHLHCNRLGMPGNWPTTLDSMAALEGHRGHLTHVQFHSYGGGPDDQGTFCSKVTRLADYVNAHPNLTVDVGHVVFGETTSMTGDGPLGHYLRKVTGKKWFNSETECEAGCGIVPIVYREKSFVHALQWCIGVEWYLLVNDPWRVAMSTDHPNGGTFLAYPEMIAVLMDRDYRREVLKKLPEKIRPRCVLWDLEREYTLNEIVIVTRAGPAKILGLKHKGHLGIGADADITIYTPGRDIKAMFEMPRMVLKAGEIVVERGELKTTPFGPTIHVQPGYDDLLENNLRPWFEKNYSMSFANYPVSDLYLSRGARVVS
ncbi:formylmethanofuran dehydrogenase subunit A [Zavarzinella formosa]|uniref:formylmethanofuran dehydrogenase subunit A n=1 Tax=Zavarzinella formosa TaxID=360055 RepID=UPI00030E7043|nr:formylmethanofuran dehydrogenase subunit A [Zavarzinella formosa]